MTPEGTVTEIGPDLYRISIYAPEFDLQFNHFLIHDDEPLLYHAGLKGMFPLLREAVAKVLEPSRLRWIGFSHFESDECGGLNDWLAIAPSAEPVCSDIGAMVSVNDFAARPAKGLADGAQFVTGKYRFRVCRTPHLPHGWDASVLFEETQKTLLCSDLFHQVGDVAPITSSDVVGRSREAWIRISGCKPGLFPMKVVAVRPSSMCSGGTSIRHASSFMISMMDEVRTMISFGSEGTRP